MSPDSRLEAEESFREGVALLEQGRAAEALEPLGRAYRGNPDNARCLSYYALALSLAKGEFLEAAELARTAVRREFYNPDLYMNLARIYLVHDFKAEAVRILRRGMMVDPGNPGIARALESLGLRRRPPLPFLPRAHALNRVLGMMLVRIQRPIAALVTRFSGA
jgi:Flp pilus assembly protein TadD